MPEFSQRTQHLQRALFVSLAVGLAWGIRGAFGGVVGAMFPGAVLALAFCHVTGQSAMMRWMPVLATVTAIGIGAGGEMSYGILHGYAKSDTFPNYTYGILALICQGGAWGVFGCAAFGLVLEQRTLRLHEVTTLVGAVLGCGYLFYHLVVTLLGFDINPPRSNLMVGYLGGAIGLFIWLIVNGKRLGLRAATCGFIAFGLGMAGGRVLGNVSTHLPFSVPEWTVMETSCGMIAGFLFAFGMLGVHFKDAPHHPAYIWLSAYAIFFVLGGIPLIHRITRFETEDTLARWTERLHGYSAPAAMAHTLLTTVNVLCIMALLGACVWLYLHHRRATRFGAMPTIMLCFIMLLLQNCTSLYFYTPRGAGVNMIDVFWLILALLVVHAVIFRKRPLPLPDAEHVAFSWQRWVGFAMLVLGVIIFTASLVNGETTMVSANTRWPVWSHSDLPVVRSVSR